MNRSPNCHRTSHHNIFGARAQLIARSRYCCFYSLVNFVLLHVNKQMEMQFLPRRGITSNQHITGGHACYDLGTCDHRQYRGGAFDVPRAASPETMSSSGRDTAPIRINQKHKIEFVKIPRYRDRAAVGVGCSVVVLD